MIKYKTFMNNFYNLHEFYLYITQPMAQKKAFLSMLFLVHLILTQKSRLDDRQLIFA